MKTEKREYLPRRLALRLYLLAFAAILLSASHACAERTIQFSWTPNSDTPAVDGYRLYYKVGDAPAESDFSAAKQHYDGTDISGGSASPITIQGAAASQYTLANLYEGKKYTFVLTAYRGSEESQPSEAIVLEAVPQAVAPDLQSIDEVK